MTAAAAAALAGPAPRRRSALDRPEFWGRVFVLPYLIVFGVFVLYLSAFATIVPIVAFGRTIGMALADLSARPETGTPGVPAAAAFRRWLGTLATAATGGLLLFWTARNAEAPTPADRLSGCALIGD